MRKKIQAPLDLAVSKSLRAGDQVLLTGTIYTSRDAGHLRLVNSIAAGEELPLPLEGAVIYYVGPTPPAPGQIIGSAGPTTSYRMDPYAPTLLAHGLRGMIGKGRRSEEVIEAMRKSGAVYFGAIGGAGALLSSCIVKSDLIAYEDLGAEALRRLEVVDMPLLVVIDSLGNNLYETGPAAYLASQDTDN
ncbi:MAG: Fe-S-containing hydro-lyase [Eubacteriales bacterium]|nr:Fe-S-containing hydro-lyase [Eubacteriales bacterium]